MVFLSTVDGGDGSLGGAPPRWTGRGGGQWWRRGQGKEKCQAHPRNEAAGFLFSPELVCKIVLYSLLRTKNVSSLLKFRCM